MKEEERRGSERTNGGAKKPSNLSVGARIGEENVVLALLGQSAL
jgi:hypothetical protein